MASFCEQLAITKDLLETALGCTVRGWTVEEGSKPGDNYMGLIASVDVQIQGSSSTPKIRHLIIKCAFHAATQQYTNKSNVFFKEYQTYSFWIPALEQMKKERSVTPPESLPYPPFVYGNVIDFSEVDYKNKVFDPLDNFIMMEDIKKTWGFRMVDRMEGLDIHHLKLVFTALATVHATTWAFKYLEGETALQNKFPYVYHGEKQDILDVWLSMAPVHCSLARRILDDEHGEGNIYSRAVTEFEPKMVDLMDILFGYTANKTHRLNSYRRVPVEDMGEEIWWRVINHSDIWSNNMMFRYNDEGRPQDVILLDLQAFKHSLPTIDLACVLYLSADVDIRRNSIAELLRVYHDAFRGVCDSLQVPILPTFTLESLERSYQTARVIGGMMALFALPFVCKEESEIVGSEEQSATKDMEEVLENVAQKTQHTNPKLKKKILDVVTELYDAGVF